MSVGPLDRTWRHVHIRRHTAIACPVDGRAPRHIGTGDRGRVRFGVLGPLEAWRGERSLPLGGERQRALLALFLVHANEVLSIERLVDAMAGGDRSSSAVNAVRVGVSRLRRAIEDDATAETLQTRPSGYVLLADADRLDCAQFEHLLAQGRRLGGTGDKSTAAGRLRKAEALWRGPALTGLESWDFLQPEIRRLAELRLLVTLERIDADLAAGAGAELIAELNRLIEANPLKERPCGQLMTALYRAGRQTEALAVYRQTSERLRDELGLEPSPELQTLERAILNHDPTLDPSPTPAPPPADHLPTGRRQLLGRRVAPVVGDVAAPFSCPLGRSTNRVTVD